MKSNQSTCMNRFAMCYSRGSGVTSWRLTRVCIWCSELLSHSNRLPRLPNNHQLGSFHQFRSLSYVLCSPLGNSRGAFRCSVAVSDMSLTRGSHEMALLSMLQCDDQSALMVEGRIALMTMKSESASGLRRKQSSFARILLRGTGWKGT